MTPLLRIRRCRNTRWGVLRWHASQQPTAYGDRRARAGVKLRLGRWQVVLAFLAVLLAAGCAPDPTAQLPSEPPTTATTTTLAAQDCPQVVVECPRPQATPGAVIASSDGVCSRDYNKRGYLNSADRKRMLDTYFPKGIPPDTKIYEVDHLIARWAGGQSTLANLWPMTYLPDVRRKDALEQHLYNTFCHRPGAEMNPAAVYQACGDSHLTLECARKMMREYWRWW